ncbi:MAG: hypothetical protein V4615_14550 [Bacteroidota bacterium]
MKRILPMLLLSVLSFVTVKAQTQTGSGTSFKQISGNSDKVITEIPDSTISEKIAELKQVADSLKETSIKSAVKSADKVAANEIAKLKKDYDSLLSYHFKILDSIQTLDSIQKAATTAKADTTPKKNAPCAAEISFAITGDGVNKVILVSQTDTGRTTSFLLKDVNLANFTSGLKKAWKTLCPDFSDTITDDEFKVLYPVRDKYDELTEQALRVSHQPVAGDITTYKNIPVYINYKNPSYGPVFKKKLEKVREKLEDIQADMNEYSTHEKFESKENEIKAIQKGIDSVEQYTNRLSERKEEVNARIGELEADMDEKKGSIDDYQLQIEGLYLLINDSIRKESKLINELKSYIDGSNEEIRFIQETHTTDSLKKLVASKVNSIKTTISVYEQDIKTATGIINNLPKKLASDTVVLHTSAEKLRKEYGEFEKVRNPWLDTIKAIDRQLARYKREKKYDKMKTDVALLKAKKEEYVPDLKGELTGWIGDIQEQIDYLNKQVGREHKRQRLNIKPLIKELTRQIKALQEEEIKLTTGHLFILPNNDRAGLYAAQVFSQSLLLPALISQRVQVPDPKLGHGHLDSAISIIKQLLLKLPISGYSVRAVSGSASVNGGASKSKVVFQDGCLENIQVEAIQNGTGQAYLFQNAYGIPLQSQMDIRNLQYIRLYEKSGSSYILLKDAFSYVKNPEQYRRDYSPSDTVIELNFDSNKIRHSVYKEAGMRFFDVRLYTDLAGIGEDNPNGLIQFEISRRFNLVSRRWQWGGLGKGWNFGFFSFITPGVVVSKIENKERYLVSDFQVRNDSTKRFATTLEIYRHQALSVGFTNNIGFLDAPSMKSTFYINSGLYYGRTPMRDSNMVFIDTLSEYRKDNTVRNYAVNTLQWQPSFTMQVFGDGRAGFSLSDYVTFFKTFTSDFTVVGNLKDISDARFNRAPPGPQDSGGRSLKEKIEARFWEKDFAMNTFELFAFFKPSPKDYGKMFFRYRFTSAMRDVTNNFHQIQLGYQITFDPIKLIKK